METSIFLLTLSVLAFFNALWIYKFYSMKRTYLKAGKCIVQLIDRIQKLETENKDLQEFNRDLIITGLKNYDKLNELTKTDKTSKKKANTKIEQKTKQSKIKGK